METMGRKKPGPRRSFTPGFKAEIVELCRRGDRSIGRRYVGDVTYIATREGWSNLATFRDLAGRRVVGWALADHMRTELLEDALKMAFAQRSPQTGLVFHSDRGCRYTSGDFATLAREHDFVPSVGCRGQCWDNAEAESFFATIKRALVDVRTWSTRTGLSARSLPVHRRLVQHPPAALDARLRQPHSVRSRPPQRRPTGGIINQSDLSVNADHVLSDIWRTGASRFLRAPLPTSPRSRQPRVARPCRVVRILRASPSRLRSAPAAGAPSGTSRWNSLVKRIFSVAAGPNLWRTRRGRDGRRPIYRKSDFLPYAVRDRSSTMATH
jgi:transposase InsO family protein